MKVSPAVRIGIGAFVVIGVVVLLASALFNVFSASIHITKGMDYYRAGRIDDAIAEDRAAVKLTPNNGVAHNNLGFYLFKKGNYAEAEAECRKALSLRPDDAAIHDSLGQILSHSGRAKEGVQECRIAVEELPSPVHKNSLAYALAQAGQTNEAKQEWRQVLAMNDSKAANEAKKMLAKYTR